MEIVNENLPSSPKDYDDTDDDEDQNEDLNESLIYVIS